MYRLLIVDDEPYIVDGLQELVKQWELPEELDVRSAYSADEALEAADLAKIDVCLTDIRMPGMDGIRLQGEMLRRWPQCKVIFLTGYDDFEYAQSAIRGGSVDYILKMESVDLIRGALERAVRELRAAEEKASLIGRAREQLEAAKPMIRRDFLAGLLESSLGRNPELPGRLDELGVGLEADKPVALIVVGIDEWKAEFSSNDRRLLLYAAQNIAEELLSPLFRLHAMPYDRSKLVLFLQASEETAWRTRDAEDRAERLQTACRSLLDLSVSVAIADAPVRWEALPASFERLLKLLQHRIGPVGELIVVDRAGTAVGAPGGPEAPGLLGTLPDGRLPRANPGRTKALDEIWENGGPEDFQRLYDEIRGGVSGAEHPVTVQKELYYAMASSFLSYVIRWDLGEALPEEFRAGRLMAMEAHRSWADIDAYFLRLAGLLLEHRERERESRSTDLIARLHAYIETHLGEDLSLNRLGEVVFLNASYLSRVYKQLTGTGLTEYITDYRIAKAKQLLADPGLKIQEIGSRVGFDSPSYFGQVFKRKTEMTPQEYRDAWC